jgi:PAB-dependent poly(A)-specific ribonuclease subunit 2
MKELRCMSYTAKDNTQLLVAGLQNQMFLIDVEKGNIQKQARSIDLVLSRDAD